MLARFVKKFRIACSPGRLWPALHSRLLPYTRGFKYIVSIPASNISIHCPAFIEPDHRELPVVERIFRSFQKMKSAQKTVSDLYQPASLWQEQLNDAYSSLNSSDLRKFHFFLSNFGAWDKYTGVEESTLIRKHARFLPTRRYLQHDVFLHLLQLWKHYYSDRKPVQSLFRPNHGNLAGAYVGGILVTVDSFFSEIYGSLLAGILKPVERPVIAELGGGCGRLAYYLLRDNESFTYLDLDLPETLCLAAYSLMLAFPSKRVLLFGEEEYSPELHEKYDFIFMPSWEIEKLKSVDLFVNECSLGEMTPEAATNYVHHIARSTRYFFHMNHDRFRNHYDGGRMSLLGREYPIGDQFTLLFRYPELKHILFNGTIDLNNDTFIYLYERNAPQRD